MKSTVFPIVCGMDEAGRGAIAGPVAAGCVVLPDDFPIKILNDSKKLSEKKRSVADKIIKEKACWGVGIVGHEVIDSINILRASMYAMSLAYNMMVKKLPEWLRAQGIALPECGDIHSFISAITDGTSNPDVPCVCRCEPKADATYPSVMAASILAKVQRDKIMVEYDALYPRYGYARHKGYPTDKHRRICREIGFSPIQRLTFKY